MNNRRNATTRSEYKGSSAREKRLSLFLLGLLAAIALALFGVQMHFDPGLWRAQPDAMGQRDAPDLDADAAAALERSAQVENLEPMSPPEHFGPETLSDKIDGKAELYLPSGFRHLESRRFTLAGDPSLWVERFVYDMGTRANAFSVYSQQRRDAAHALDLTPDAYQSANGIFLVQGSYYIEIIGSDTSEALMEKMIALARAFVDEHPAEAVALDERELLPEQHRVADSIVLTASNAFGFEGFDHIYSARYDWAGRTAMAFVSQRASAQEAERLVQAYGQFLLDFGGRPIEPPADAPPVKIIEILGYIQVVFSHGGVLAGVNEAEDLETALALAVQLYRNVREGADGP